MTYSSSENDETNRSYLSIIMYSDEEGEVMVEGDEEEQLPNGIYEQHDDDTIFQIDDLPTEHHIPSSSPGIQVRYYAPVTETPHGLSQSVRTNESDHFMRSMVNSRSFTENGQESYSPTSSESDCPVLNSHDDILLDDIDNNTIYSQSAPVISFLSDFYMKPIPSPSETMQKEEEPKITQVTVPIRENKLLLDQQSQVVQVETKEETDNTDDQHIVSVYKPKNNLKMVLRSMEENDSLDDWDDLATTYFGIKKESYVWKSQINFSHESLWLRNSAIASKYLSLYSVLMKVTGLSKFTKHRDIKDLFFSCNVLSIRYISPLRCAYITYQNYEQMMDAISRYNGTSLRLKRIQCRPSCFEEMETDNKFNSLLLYYSSNTNQLPDQSNIFIPERHGILQSKDYNNFTQMSLPIQPTRLVTYDSYPNYTQHPFYKFKNLSTIRLISNTTGYSSYYVVLKPWLNLDVQISQNIQYWSISLEKAFLLNFLFSNSYEVNLLFSVKGTKAFQGYAVMKSEVLDLRQLTDDELFGTIFKGKGAKYQTKPSGRPWRYVFRVEWKSMKKVGFKTTKDYLNPWLKNSSVNNSKDCTMIEPRVGEKIIQDMMRS